MIEEEIKPEEELDLSVEWQTVKELAAGGEPALWAMAVIEAEKIFRETLSVVSFGSSVKERIRNARRVFHNIASLLDARELYRKITNDIGFVPTQEETTGALEAYFQAILDLTSFDRPVVGTWQHLQNTLFLRFGRIGRYFRAALILVVLFFAAVWFLADTTWGKTTVSFLVNLTNFALHYLGFIVVGIIVIVLLIFLSFIYSDRGGG